MTYQAVLAEAWRAHLAPRAADAPTIVSLFAGCGGSSLGYSMAGFRELLAVEWDVKAAATFRANFPGIPMHVGDICALTDDEALRLAGVAAGELDVLDGSPPCQGFSTAGKRQMDDPRNSLFREHVRLLRAFRPRAFVMENVSGLVKGKMRLAFAEITVALKAAGYQVTCRLIDASWLGVPQERKRLIWIGVRDDLGSEPVHPKPRQPRWSIRQAIEADAAKNAMHFNRWRSADLPSPTITKTRPPVIRHGAEGRAMTIAECARVGSFPDAFRWPTERDAISQIGNSVPPLMMRAIAEQVHATLDGTGRTFAEVAAERRGGDDAPPDPPK